MVAMTKLVEKLGNAVKKVAEKKGTDWWYTPLMAAASRAIAERVPLVDFVLEVRDARIPWSSKYDQHLPFSSRHIIVLNKMDLANNLQMKEWMMYFNEQSCMAVGVNAHNKEIIKELLNFLQGKVRDLNRNGDNNHTSTVLLIGLPNVGKSALANSLHQIGRIGSAEKGRLRRAIVNTQPGETKDISSFKIASNPNIYILDSPGILPPEILDDEVCSKLALSGIISDDLVGKEELARYILAILSSSVEYKKWAKLSAIDNEKILDKEKQKMVNNRQGLSDHTQDFVVNAVRRTLLETISSFTGNLNDEDELEILIDIQITALQKVLCIPPCEDADVKIEEEIQYVIMQAIKEKMNDMNAMRKAKHEAKEEEKAQQIYAKELAKARTEVAHEVKLAKDAEAEMELHINKAASKALEHQAKQNQGFPPTGGSISGFSRSFNTGGHIDPPEMPLGISSTHSGDYGSTVSGDYETTISGLTSDFPASTASGATSNKKLM